MKKIFLLLILSYCNTVFSQDYPRQKLDVDAFVDELFQQQDEGVNYEFLYENLINYYQNPIDLNKADYEEISAIMVLSDKQIKNLQAHIKKNGKLLSIYELQSIEGFDLNTIYKILPFSAVDNVVMNIDAGPLWKRIASESNNSIMIRTERILEDQKGYNPTPKADGSLPSHYLGNPWKHYIRYRVSHKNDFSIGFLAETDKGEQFAWDPATNRYGMDFYSFHFQTYNKGKFKKIAIGDYQMQFGQSLIYAGGFLIGKGAETINSVRRTNVGIRPYTSAIEGGFFRGAAATYELTKRIDVTLMGSYKGIDSKSNVSGDTIEIDDPDAGSFTITSLNFGGNHRTESEINKKNTSSITDLGTNVTYSSKDKNLTFGVSALQTMYGDSVIKNQITRNVNEFKGKAGIIYGANYSYNWENFNLFGELAQSQSGGIGAVQGIVGSLSKKLQIAIHLRYYSADFHSLYGDPFAESNAKNEQGIYWGMKYKFNRKWELSSYYDKFNFPWLKSQIDQPSFGDEYLARLHYKPKRGVAIYFQLKHETKLKNQVDNTTKIDFSVPTTKQTQLLNFDYRVNKIVSLKSRVQWSSFQQSNAPSLGYALIQDVNFKLSGKWRIATRYAIFDTDDFDNRQYSYEKDVLYAYSIYSYSGVGVRKFILLRYTPFRKLDIWIKLALTTYDYQQNHTISSSLEEIKGNNRTDLRIQMRYKF